jgi:hypothetical protein
MKTMCRSLENLNVDKVKRNFKQNLSVGSYLSISNFEYRKLITKLRISEHNLLIEKKIYESFLILISY